MIFVSEQAGAVCTGLLARPIKERLGSGEDGAAGIKKQAFWSKLTLTLTLTFQLEPKHELALTLTGG